MLIRRSTEVTMRLWSGGTTRELLIAPEGSDYARRDFHIRLSTATVESEESMFTPLIGYERHLMVLEGQAHLVHQGQRSDRLSRFQTSTFDGAWQTQSFGLYRDFNLILRYGNRGYISHQHLSPRETLHLLREEALVRAIYLERGRLELVNGDIINCQDMLMVEPGDRLFLRALESSDLILATFTA
ncbi:MULTISPECIES: HutD family protein [Halomonas]|uniref:HutD family protein n=1 Tax=Halomonas TaxID=2745 RepID=UPI001C9748AB|nr:MULTISPECIES: HutD family protein [Halomonas]MBY6207331.1 HutD family protein [Halomonas sp. DP3Y7-2]MBY6228140.1 HutD family protein [Halomonas sp. DP3Y7-1]MCA0916206.1 HutD family protein [Halomonas denitrificans]